jgi:hypothetical protein
MKALKPVLRVIFVILLSWESFITISSAQQQSNVIFRDDFIGKTLNPKWQIVGPDKDRWTLVENEYFLIVTAKKGANVLQFKGELPDDYEIIVKVQTPPQYEHQVVRLLSVRDDANNVRISYQNLKIRFYKTLRGETSEISRDIGKLSQDAQLYLKLIKRGFEYTGAYGTDGSTWFNIGTHIFFNLDGKLAIEAYNAPPTMLSLSGSTSPIESGIRFDYFEIRKLSQ